jgi:hypothetical protein
MQIGGCLTPYHVWDAREEADYVFDIHVEPGSPTEPLTKGMVIPIPESFERLSLSCASSYPSSDERSRISPVERRDPSALGMLRCEWTVMLHLR